MTQLTLEDARRISDTALDTSIQHGWHISVAVIDRHGNLVHFARQDGSTLGSVVSSQSKAWTAAALGASTHELQAAAQPGQARPCMVSPTGGRAGPSDDSCTRRRADPFRERGEKKRRFRGAVALGDGRQSRSHRSFNVDKRGPGDVFLASPTGRLFQTPAPKDV